MRLPRWPWVAAILLGLTQPLVHLCLVYLPPEGAVHSGLSVPDSALFLQSMDMFQTGFYSPYAICDSPWGEYSLRYYSVPHLWVYGVLGWLGHWVNADNFLLLGIVNGLSLSFYLVMVWRFLLVITPSIAQPAFALFALSSGPAGLIWLATAPFGIHDSPGFERWFFRFALYDLVEGPHFHPLLIAPRCYYTFPLGLFYGGLAALASSTEGIRRRQLLWAPWVILATFIYARAGLFSIAIAVLVAGYAAPISSALRTLFTPSRLLALSAYAIPVGIGVIASSFLMRLNPATIQNHLEITSMAMWISPALLSLSLLLPAVFLALPGLWAQLPDALRRVTGVFAGYLAAYVLLYLGRAFYYGTLLTGSDGAVALAVSDLALLGAPVGLLLAWQRPQEGAEAAAPSWILPWMVAFMAISISGWGSGWFLQFGPQRLQVFLWLPACILAATGVQRLTPHARRFAWSLWLVAGAASIYVTLTHFQVGIDRKHAAGPFAIVNAQWISKSDADAIAMTQGATVLAKPLLGDAAVHRASAKAPFAVGGFNLSATPYSELHRHAEHFFSEDASDADRRKLIERWCVDYILISNLRPIPNAVRQNLKLSHWLVIVYDIDGTCLLRVQEGNEIPSYGTLSSDERHSP